MERPPGVPAEFDVRTVVYLRRGDHPPELDEDASTALHHAHLAYLGGPRRARDHRGERPAARPVRPDHAGHVGLHGAGGRGPAAGRVRPGRPRRPVPGRRRPVVRRPPDGWPSPTTTVPSASGSVRGPLMRGRRPTPTPTSPLLSSGARRPRREPRRRVCGGSVALDAYQPGRSDIDVALVTASRSPTHEKHALVGALRHEALPVPARGLELVVYTGRAAASGSDANRRSRSS